MFGVMENVLVMHVVSIDLFLAKCRKQIHTKNLYRLLQLDILKQWQ